MTERLPPELARALAPYDPPIRRTFAAARAAILEHCPSAAELVYDSYNAVAAAYSFTGRLGDAFCHVAAYAKHVNLGFNRGSELRDPEGLLQGSGKHIRHIRLADAAAAEQPHVREFIAQAAERAPRGEGEASAQTIVKTVSQRKRRPSG